ncbi:hypothetical protein [Actinomadura sp. DC4]|uniref:hypothetical protein n=1 Tax=Actinomadura sp. DC4 TaxID=3055069 RepID=UPI0025AFCBEB|nr:hypothetical protein [Actinomadura sp. DC4]MDN3353948.1 hypothetical protein [Actinomadura sp. DC4]
MHIKLAGDAGHTGTITASTLFWVQGILAGVVAVLVLVRPRPVPYLIAFLVAASALGAVLLYRYVDVGTLGPLPEMYEPVWYTDKVLAAVAEAVATVAAAIGFAVTAKTPGAVGAGRRRSVDA